MLNEFDGLGRCEKVLLEDFLMPALEDLLENASPFISETHACIPYWH